MTAVTQEGPTASTVAVTAGQVHQDRVVRAAGSQPVFYYLVTCCCSVEERKQTAAADRRAAKAARRRVSMERHADMERREAAEEIRRERGQ